VLNPKPLPRTSLEPVCEAFGGVIRRQRIARGQSLNRLAELTKFSRQTLSYIETNRVPAIYVGSSVAPEHAQFVEAPSLPVRDRIRITPEA
jgi:hypothetical protein